MWKKTRRAVLRGEATGRRWTRCVETQEPRPGSTWQRRHPGEVPAWLQRWLAGGAA